MPENRETMICEKRGNSFLPTCPLRRELLLINRLINNFFNEFSLMAPGNERDRGRKEEYQCVNICILLDENQILPSRKKIAAAVDEPAELWILVASSVDSRSDDCCSL